MVILRPKHIVGTEALYHEDVLTHVFLNTGLVGRERSASRDGRYTPEERAPGTHWI
jgi:hypothetical protein